MGIVGCFLGWVSWVYTVVGLVVTFTFALVCGYFCDFMVGGIGWC